MLEGLLQPPHLVMILAIALVVFGPARLPELGKGLGEAIRGFKAAIQGEPPPAPHSSVNPHLMLVSGGETGRAEEALPSPAREQAALPTGLSQAVVAEQTTDQRIDAPA
jgi:sec-independent protein translocase protein TatA